MSTLTILLHLPKTVKNQKNILHLVSIKNCKLEVSIKSMKVLILIIKTLTKNHKKMDLTNKIHLKLAKVQNLQKKDTDFLIELIFDLTNIK